MIRPKKKPRPPGLLLGRPGRGYVTQNSTARNVLSLWPKDFVTGIFAKWCRDINCVLSGAPTAGDSNRRPGLATTQVGWARHDQPTNAAACRLVRLYQPASAPRSPGLILRYCGFGCT